MSRHLVADDLRIKQSGDGSSKRPILRRADQAIVALLVSSALAGMGVYWVVQGGPRGELIEIDGAEPLTARYQVDVNKAQWFELAELPEVGETLARRIIESRDTRGLFKDNNQLRRVRGIGPRTLEKIMPYLLPLPDEQDVAGDSNSDKNAL
ncbi:MAG TPA: helix-hairpin-helix domain-containing protein [Lacipirellulaceae bacterium]|jgi:competence protein ComEA|nr:helix-hairpin-helix domain-containing protein [Lacipirellulaceae bacterium]